MLFSNTIYLEESMEHPSNNSDGGRQKVKKRIYIYAVHFPTKNKYYIGQSYDVKNRLEQHRVLNYPVGKALRKYNNYQVFVLHTCETRDEANLIEIEEIRNFNSIVPNGYNLTRGGGGVVGHKLTAEQRANKRKAQIKNWEDPEYRANQVMKHTGKKRSVTAIEKSRIASTGRKKSEAEKEKIRIGNTGKKCSAEHCKHISESLIGRKQSAVTIAKKIKSRIGMKYNKHKKE